MYTIKLTQWLENNGKFSYSRSSGPGGQNVNKVNTKATIILNINDIPFISDHEKLRICNGLSNRINNNNELILTCEEERTQSKNRSKLIYKTVLLIEKSLVIKKHRKPTKPSKASKARRIETKKIQSLKKFNRSIKAVY